MRRVVMALGVLGLVGLGGAAGAHECRRQTSAGSTVRIVRQERGMFNAVRVNRDLPRQVCEGAEPIAVEVFHTFGDGMAAVLTGILYTPAHLRVTCPAPMALR